MSKFLRDEFLTNITISEQLLIEIKKEIVKIAEKENKNKVNEMKEKNLFITYTIRFDNQGFRMYGFEEAIEYYKKACIVERFLFNLNSGKSLSTNGLFGKSISLWFDSKEPINCQLVVQDDDKDWTDSIFIKIKEILKKYKNKNHVFRNKWIPFILQLLGIMVVFLTSYWVSVQIAPKLTIENALAFIFLISLILFSNVWSFVFNFIIKYIYDLYPNLSFKEKERFNGIKRFFNLVCVSLLVLIIFQLAINIGGFFRGILK